MVWMEKYVMQLTWLPLPALLIPYYGIDHSQSMRIFRLGGAYVRPSIYSKNVVNPLFIVFRSVFRMCSPHRCII